ncbi:hypothetical protein OAJ67_04990 [Candidatus Nitrosopelagicus sp.]|nr:hypothetical protein [Candidatus Nitrosopelagicus sp.]
MNKNVGIAVGIGIAIIIGVIIFQITETTWQQSSVEEYYEKDGKVSSVVYPDNPQLLGPLQINKDKYLLGEHIYVIVKDLRPQDQGNIDFFTPNGVLYETIGFDGAQKDFYKKYFKPQLLKGKNLCEKEDLIGEWKVTFRGYEMAQINFEILPEILPQHEEYFVECEIAYELDPTTPGSMPPSEKFPGSTPATDVP